MEWWILGGVLLAGAAAIAVVRLRHGRRGRAEADTNNIYPLW
jgi:hypothetical protein